jgi:deoxyhypusine synthase
MIVLAGGIVKHHVCNANLMRNGANFSVFINTGQNSTDQIRVPALMKLSLGEIRINAQPVKVCAYT